MDQGNIRRYVLVNAILVGFVGGMGLAIVQLVFHYFKVSKVNYEKVFSLFYIKAKWIEKWYGALSFILFIGVLSIFIALIYYIICRRIKGWISGALFGIGLWLIFGLLIPTLLYDITWISYYKSNTNILQLCLFLLYGIFIGYSISYDEEMRSYEIENT